MKASASSRTIATIGIDIGKNTFHLVGLDERGAIVLRQKSCHEARSQLAWLTPGEAHDNRLCSVLLTGLRPRTMLLADRGYDADWIRALASQQGAWANIPPKRNRKDPICFSPYLYRARNLVERFFNKIKQCRRIATRYDKLAANYLAFIKLAAIRIWLRVYESTA
jgi:transposase